MGNFQLRVSALLVVQFLFWGLVVAALVMAATDRYFHATLRRSWLFLLISIFATLVWRVPVDSAFFQGMEYEDAYIYTVAARQILQGSQISEPTESYLTTVCDVGSLDTCQSATTYSGHYIGSPYVFSLAARVLGYKPAIPALVGMGAACITVVLVFFIGCMLSDNPAVPIFSAAVFAMTPVFAVYGIGSYAEPLSNMCASIGVLAYLRYLYSRPAERTAVSNLAALCTWSFALLFAIVVKRENLLIAFVLPLASMVRIGLRHEPKPAWCRVGVASVASGLAIAFAVVPLRFAEVLVNETSEYHHIPFGLTQVRGLLPAFAVSFGVISWYCLGLVWVLYGILLIRRSGYRALYPLFLVLGYLSLYVSHIRSYYQLNYGDVAPSDTLRYSMNFMTMWALLAGFGFGHAAKNWLPTSAGLRWRSAAPIVALVIYGVIAYRYTNILRDEVTREEQHTRIEPAVAAARLALAMGPADTFVVTAEPLIIQIYAPSRVNVIELTRVDADMIAALQSRNSHLKIIYIDSAVYRDEIDQKRYRTQMEFLRRFGRKSLYGNDQFEIVELDIRL